MGAVEQPGGGSVSRLGDQWRCLLAEHRRMFGLTPRQQLGDLLAGVALALIVLTVFGALGLMPDPL